MGGPGSMRWNGYEKKLTVERCFFLDINQLRREIYWGHRMASVLKPAGMPWNIHGMNEKVGSVGFELVGVGNAGLIIHLRYSVNHGGRDQSVFETIRFKPTRLCYGGLRWWFTCPRVPDGKPCLHRIGQDLPLGGLYFGSRHCYNLTYMRSQNLEGRIEMRDQVRYFLSGFGSRIFIQKNHLRG